MISHKIKCKPPPLHLSNNVEECPQLVDALATSKESRVCNKGDDHAEFSFLYESALIDLLDESELMPFNLHTAASLGITECVRSLIERCNIDVNLKNNGSWTSLMYASLFSHVETVLYLLEIKADVHMENPSGKTPLMLASLCGSEEILKLLLQHGANLEVRDSNDFTALMLAIQATHSEAAQLLLDYGANPNVQEGIHGQCALYIASQSGQFTIVRALVDKGVDVEVKTSSGDSAYHVALRNGYTAIASLIREQHNAKSPLMSQLKVTAPLLAPVPSRYRPKSPYSTFFQQYSEIPEVVIDSIDPGVKWKPHEGAIRRSPEGVESPLDHFNPLNAWPGTSMIFKQAVCNRGGHFKKSITKPRSSTLADGEVLPSPWSPPPAQQSFPILATSVKLPKDLSSVLANLGLAKYQMHFEEQDIDLQVFLTMNETDLREIGINSLGARRKFLSTIDYFQTRSNYYRISEEFLINTWVSKKDLASLKVVWDEIVCTVVQLRNQIGCCTMTDLLMSHIRKAEDFFMKY